jgi:tetratricopeptide (TPR) repeat protein
MRTKAALLTLLVPGVILFAGAANAEYTYMGHCSDDSTLPAENIISACTGFISKAFQENWQLEDVPAALDYEATAYERLGKSNLALAELKTAISKYNWFTPAWEHLGELLEKLRGPGMLEATLDGMLRANPNDADVLNEACWYRAKKGEQLDAALADCDAALQLKPGDADILDSRAFAHFRKGSFAQAIADASAALAKNPKMATSLYVRGLAKLKSGDAAGGNTDVAAAKGIDGKVVDTYAAYGVAP